MSINKLIVGGLLSTGLLIATNDAMATRLQVTGVPVKVWANNGNASAWSDQFTVTGASVGTCPGSSTGVYATIRSPGTTAGADPQGSRIWNLVLAAALANKPVTVLLDDSVTDSNGRCVALFVIM
jgi:hypothetical protein